MKAQEQLTAREQLTVAEQREEAQKKEDAKLQLDSLFEFAPHAFITSVSDYKSVVFSMRHSKNPQAVKEAANFSADFVWCGHPSAAQLDTTSPSFILRFVTQYMAPLGIFVIFIIFCFKSNSIL